MSDPDTYRDGISILDLKIDYVIPNGFDIPTELK
jgi:hypothetical protein